MKTRTVSLPVAWCLIGAMMGGTSYAGAFDDVLVYLSGTRPQSQWVQDYSLPAGYGQYSYQITFHGPQAGPIPDQRYNRPDQFRGANPALNVPPTVRYADPRTRTASAGAVQNRRTRYQRTARRAIRVKSSRPDYYRNPPQRPTARYRHTASAMIPPSYRNDYPIPQQSGYSQQYLQQPMGRTYSTYYQPYRQTGYYGWGQSCPVGTS